MTAVTLNSKSHEIKWDMRAKMRNASLDKPVWFTELYSKRGLYVLCALIWSAAVDRDEMDEYPQPEDIADLLDTPEKQQEALDRVMDMAREAGLLKPRSKNGQGEAPKPSSRTGASPSSSSASPPTQPGA